jgi:aryl carrier-like protein
MNVLKENVVDLLGEEPADDDNLFDLGFDSIRLMMLVERLRDAGYEVNLLDLAEEPTLAAWNGVVAAAAPKETS